MLVLSIEEVNTPMGAVIELSPRGDFLTWPEVYLGRSPRGRFLDKEAQL